MKRLLLYTLLMLAAMPVFATSIVILITPQYILLGADSKRIYLDEQFRVTADRSVCKIRRVNQYCFVMAGYVASGYTAFSADSIVVRHLQKGSYAKAVAAIKKDISKALQKNIRYQKTYHPASFHQLLASKEHLLELALLRMQNGTPQVQIIGFRLTDEQKLSVGTYTAACPGDCPGRQVQLYFLGEYAGMEHHLGTKPSTSDPVLLVEELIGVQAATTPTSVGKPVSIIRYSAEGVEWVR